MQDHFIHSGTFFFRKKTLMCNNVIAIIGGIMMFSAKYVGESSYYVLVVLMIAGRIVIGINAGKNFESSKYHLPPSFPFRCFIINLGLNTITAPMYVAEIAPVDLRGSLGTLFQFGVVLALFLAQILGLPMLLGMFVYSNLIST